MCGVSRPRTTPSACLGFSGVILCDSLVAAPPVAAKQSRSQEGQGQRRLEPKTCTDNYGQSCLRSKCVAASLWAFSLALLVDTKTLSRGPASNRTLQSWCLLRGVSLSGQNHQTADQGMCRRFWKSTWVLVGFYLNPPSLTSPKNGS